MKPTVPTPSMGILQLHEAGEKFHLSRYAPSAQLSPFVKHYWIVSWDLSGEEPHAQDVVPNPCVNLVIEAQRSGIYGAASSKYTKILEGTGHAFGVKFRPGGFYPFLQSPLSRLTDQSLALSDIFGPGAEAEAQQIRSAPSPDAMIALAEALLQSKLPEPDETVQYINTMIDRIQEDRHITRVEHICQQFSLNIRRLQRLFNQYVGVSPKWVIQLYRLQNAAEALDLDRVHAGPGLSADLGYYDQSHFIRDFKTVIGKTPEEYGRR
ncbi:AraC family transcriptional regulator [Paenibacillus sp. y28]|uniref:AraC family transcriptional regulator n=1 Tax=Paenibacillus sp. y28 TaxID=3129110 RepID=UPI0030176DF0